MKIRISKFLFLIPFIISIPLLFHIYSLTKIDPISNKSLTNINILNDNNLINISSLPNISVIENDSTYILEVFACLDSKKNEDCLVIQSEATYADVKQCELQASQVNNDLLDLKERGLMLNLSCKAIDTNIFAKKQNLSIYQIDS